MKRVCEPSVPFLSGFGRVEIANRASRMAFEPSVPLGKRSIGRPPHVFSIVAVLAGTKGSNPSSSSTESCANQTGRSRQTHGSDLPRQFHANFSVRRHASPICVRLGIGPLAQAGLDKALGLAVGAGLGALCADSFLSTSRNAAAVWLRKAREESSASFLVLRGQLSSPGRSWGSGGTGELFEAFGKLQDRLPRARIVQLPSYLPCLFGAVEPLQGFHEVTNVGNDRSQLAGVAKQAKDTLRRESLDVVADRGYFNSTEILACEEAGITVTLPKPMTSNAKADISGI